MFQEIIDSGIPTGCVEVSANCDIPHDYSSCVS
jgi:hypothetical protein